MDLDKIMTSTLPKTEEEQFLLIDRDGNIVYEQGTRRCTGSGNVWRIFCGKTEI